MCHTVTMVKMLEPKASRKRKTTPSVAGTAAPSQVVQMKRRKTQDRVIKPLTGQDAVTALINAGIMTTAGALSKAYR